MATSQHQLASHRRRLAPVALGRRLPPSPDPEWRRYKQGSRSPRLQEGKCEVRTLPCDHSGPSRQIFSGVGVGRSLFETSLALKRTEVRLPVLFLGRFWGIERSECIAVICQRSLTATAVPLLTVVMDNHTGSKPRKRYDQGSEGKNVEIIPIYILLNELSALSLLSAWKSYLERFYFNSLFYLLLLVLCLIMKT